MIPKDKLIEIAIFGGLGGISGASIALLWIAGFKAEAIPAQPESPPWTCPKCGEAIEPQFTECWNCGASKPEA